MSDTIQPQMPSRFSDGQQVLVTRILTDSQDEIAMVPGDFAWVLEARSTVMMIRTEHERAMLLKEEQYSYRVRRANGASAWTDATALTEVETR